MMLASCCAAGQGRGECGCTRPTRSRTCCWCMRRPLCRTPVPLRTVRSAMTTMNGAAVADMPQGRRKSARLLVRHLCNCAVPGCKLQPSSRSVRVHRRPEYLSAALVPSSLYSVRITSDSVEYRKHARLLQQMCCPCLAATGTCCSSRCSSVASTFAIGAARGLQTLFVGCAAARVLRRAAVKCNSPGKAALLH